MSHDPWLKELRIGWATADPALVEGALAAGIPVDALQHAGCALLAAGRSDGLVAIAPQLIEALDVRNWLGDAELIIELEHYINDTALDLTPLAVDLDILAEALEQQGSAIIDVAAGFVWPSDLLEIGEGPDDVDLSSDQWIVVDGEGSRTAYAVMQRFVETIDDPGLAERLHHALAGSGAFRRFRTTLSRDELSFTRWHRFREDARLGRARAWLADNGYKRTNAGQGPGGKAVRT